MKNCVKYTLVVAILVIIFSACHRPELPTVSTISATSVTETSATLNGEIINDGNGTISHAGFMFGTTSDLSNAHGIYATSPSSTFSVNVEDLISGETYYYQAFATNEAGSAYGEIKQFTASSNWIGGETGSYLNYYYSNDFEEFGIGFNEIGELYASEVRFYANLRLEDNIPASSIKIGINCSKNRDFSSSHIYELRAGSAYVNCYENSIDMNEWQTDDNGNFIYHYYMSASTSFSLVGLSPATTYYCRGYVIIDNDTIFSEPNQFTTTLEHDYGSFTDDRDGNTYRTVTLGNQTWMAENLRYLPQINSCNDASSIDKRYSILGYTGFLEYDNSYTVDIEKAKELTITKNRCIFNAYDAVGVLYNYWAAIDQPYSSGINDIEGRGVCPNGWHIPTNNEWEELINYISSQDEYSCSSSTAWLGNSKSLAVPFLWGEHSVSCCTGSGISSNNATGFSAYPSIISCNKAEFATTCNTIEYTISSNSRTLDKEERVEPYWPADFNSNYVSVRCVRDN